MQEVDLEEYQGQHDQVQEVLEEVVILAVQVQQIQVVVDLEQRELQDQMVDQVL
jgi:hypothetical protein|tara:strand:+ start:278 stop:439 length:162 start_codon:yes stop_codon:yes gene_type:complete